MSKQDYHHLLELVNVSKQIGYSLVLGDKIKLITFTNQGETDKTYTYDYDEVNCVQRIETRINERAQRLCSQWGSHFLEFASIAFTANHRIDIGLYTANVIAHVDAAGNLVTDTAKYEGTNEKIVLQCPFSSDGLHQVSNYFTDLFYGIKLREYEDSAAPNAASEKEEDGKMSNTAIPKATSSKLSNEELRDIDEALKNPHVRAAIITMWYCYDDKEQQHFMDNHGDDGRMTVIRKVLGYETKSSS